ncbi:MAG: hypothetical protein IJH67_03680 [Thermoguttaceae bacterium]|nr:hypothetical protein [Thermoguttaceae bacterium]
MLKFWLPEKRKRNAETADYPQNTQTGWECGDNANYVVYATIPARLIILKIASGHRVIA